ncbi:MAG: SCO family protein [Calditrichia bacterium]
MQRFVLLLLFFLPLLSVSAQDEESFPGSEVYRNLGAQVDLSLNFFDEDSNYVTLDELIDKPTVVSFVYYNCPGICTPLLSGVIDVFNRLDLEPGEDFEALTLSFNELEGPTLAKAKKANYFKSLTREFPNEAWPWLSGKGRQIRKFTDKVGFKFIPSGKDFFHPPALIILSPEGKVVRYFQSTSFSELDLRLALLEAQDSWGPTLTDSFLQMSFIYDADQQRYVPNMWRIIIVGGLLFGVIFISLVRFIERRRAKVTAA